MTQARLALHVDEERERRAVRRPHRVVRVGVVVLPRPADGAGLELEHADGVTVARAAGEGEAPAVRRPGGLAGEEPVAAADEARGAGLDVDDYHGRVLAAGAGGDREVHAVRRPARGGLGVGVLGEQAQSFAARERLRRHDGDGVAGAVRDREGEARAVGREVRVGERREVGRVRQEVDERAGRAVPAVDVVALRAAVVAGEVDGAAVRRELGAPAAVVQVADAARSTVRQVADEDLPVAALVPLERDGVARRREREGPEVLADGRRGRQLFDERRSHGSPSDRCCPDTGRGSVAPPARAQSSARFPWARTLRVPRRDMARL